MASDLPPVASAATFLITLTQTLDVLYSKQISSDIFSSLSFDHNTCFYLQVYRWSTRNLLHGRKMKSVPLRRTLSGGKLLILCYCFVLRPRSLAAGEHGRANKRGDASPRMISLFRFRETVRHGRAFSLPKGIKRWFQLRRSSCVEKVCAN